ncbi:hypothetical protein BKA82DRAFT_4084233 [Pisolithus tinctorius]|nr:hypothetical protein BKA82DRAFT_4084233 [Pisolithus tinctorius]
MFANIFSLSLLMQISPLLLTPVVQTFLGSSIYKLVWYLWLRSTKSVSKMEMLSVLFTYFLFYAFNQLAKGKEQIFFFFLVDVNARKATD